jgi:hypothetical protein
MKRTQFFTFWLLIGASCICGICSKDVQKPNSQSQDTSVAGQIAGTYIGLGKNLPDNIYLGKFNGCVIPPNWESNFKTGQAIAKIIKVSDNTVNVSLSGGPFTYVHTNSDVTVIQSGANINLPFGNYNANTGFLSVSINNAQMIYTPSPSCLQGMPYYSGGSILNDGVYQYYTHARLEFSGTKQ